MGRELFHSPNTSTKKEQSVSPQNVPSSNSNGDHIAVKYFLPIRLIAQLRRLISLMEAENKKDKQKIMECEEAIQRRCEKIVEYRERMNDVQKQMEN